MLRRLKELFHELKCIQYGKFKLVCGEFSNYKIFCDPLFENSEARNIIGTIGYQMFQKIGSRHDMIGVVTGGYEFAKLVAEISGRKAISVNPHNGKVKGKIKRKNVCYFEDVVNTGGSILKCRNIVGKYDGKNNYAISIVDREEGGKENLKDSEIELNPIFTKSELEINI